MEIKVHERVCAHGLWVCPSQEKNLFLGRKEEFDIASSAGEKHPDELLDEVGWIGWGKKNGFPGEFVLISQALDDVQTTMFFDQSELLK
ncbi:hypothetical protein JTB14_035497 [Gonioctena quinquepunctata]|nr:hypothetical protein JTB14_035497 [Gonioctena quinquepunctata]